ncbi:hypothetical protein QYE76_032287 [Lolium multiflorum]|uniref:Reverse transcriptase Ty1/copia-type domain-containing protein n=1 Tax=Lolium multiflorum TaxID=4521 RepID=A0AAD8VJ85_LOLMU|nr:hypothetical protein QYE76_032287 [Lolium multiflorum]
MGKPRDTKIAILPSTTRKGTTLSTSAALDSPSVIDKLVSPPHASRAGTSAESENSHNIDNVSAVLDDSGSLGSFLDATIARSRQIENTETPNATTPVKSPELDYSSDDPDEDYVELDDDFIEKCNATTDARKIKKLLAEHAVRYKPSPDPKFATSPINIRDKDYDFSLDLSHIAIVEKTPFCGTEKESVVEHMTELSTLSGVFSDDVKMRTYFVAKIFPFSLKDDAKTWYNNLPPGSIKSPTDLRDVFFRKYFPASAQHAALQRIYNFDQEDGEKLPEAWARFCSLIRAQPDHDLEKHDLLDIFYSGLTIESRAYLDSCAGCVFRKRTPDDAEELLAKIGRNHDDWSTPEPTPTPIVKKRGMIKLNDEDMREAKKSLKEKGIKPEDVKNLPPIEDICETIPPSSMIEYMKDIVTNKRKVPNEEISTMLANYSFNGKIPKKLGDPVPEDVPVPPAPVTEEANDNDHETSSEVATEPRRSTRERTTPDWYDPCLNLMIVDNNDEDPATYEEAMMSPDSNKWQEAMKSEMGSMYDNKVWTLVDLPDSRKAVENKWIFKRKTDADGNVTVYKARLVAKGFRQIQGVDYDETFSPVAKLKSVRILLAIAAFFDYEIWQMDVKTAFLNGDIEEELYMVQPKGFVDPKNADMVCKLQRSIYGLKQASRSWNRRFDKVIKDFGFIQCHGEACIYKKVSGSSVAFLILYVDDILLIGNDIELLSSVKGYLNKCFSMKDLGEAAYILGIKIYRDRSRRLIGLSQSTYLDKILKKFRMDESKKGFLPMLPGKVLSKTQGPATAEERERMNQIPYASAVGSIMYAMLCTRPDIAHAVSLTSRYQSDPGMEHWTTVKNILKYLKRTKDMFLCYGGDQELVVTSYTDASWNTDPDDSKSQSGYVFILNGAAVSWCSSKQCTVAKSSTESEYIAASEASSEAVWMKRFIVELGVVPSALDPLVIYCDNMGAIANAQEPRSHKKLKHIKLRFHSIREYIEDGEVKICKVHTDLNVADPLTKALPRAKHDQHQNAMGVRYLTM